MSDLPVQEPELQFAVNLARLADQTRCHNVVLLDVRGKSPVTKFFLIATGTSDRQRRTVGDELSLYGKLNGFPAWRTNGYDTAKWIIIDCVDVVAHIFEEASRNFYDLEMLWGDCPRVQWRLPQDAPTSPPQPSIAPSVKTEVVVAAVADTAESEVPEVEEFVDNEMVITDMADSNGILETHEVEMFAVQSSAPAKAASKKKPAAKRHLKTSGKTPKTSGTKLKTIAKVKTKTKPKTSAKAMRTKTSPKAVRTKAKTSSARTVPVKKAAKAISAKPAAKKTAVKTPAKRKPTIRKSARSAGTRSRAHGSVKVMKKSGIKGKKGKL